MEVAANGDWGEGRGLGGGGELASVCKDWSQKPALQAVVGIFTKMFNIF